LTAPRDAPAAQSSFWDAVRASFRFKIAFAAAAVLLLAAVVVWRSERPVPSSSQTRVEAERDVPRPQPEADRQRVEEPPTREQPPSASLVATFVLSPGVVRSGRGPAGFVLASTIANVRAQLELDPGVEYPSYRVELRDSRARVLWSEDGRRAEAGSTVTVTIPATVFETGEFEIVLLGRAGGGPPEDAGHYYFDVIKQ
jgi:hypothetical protein